MSALTGCCDSYTLAVLRHLKIVSLNEELSSQIDARQDFRAGSETEVPDRPCPCVFLISLLIQRISDHFTIVGPSRNPSSLRCASRYRRRRRHTCRCVPLFVDTGGETGVEGHDSVAQEQQQHSLLKINALPGLYGSCLYHEHSCDYNRICCCFVLEHTTQVVSIQNPPYSPLHLCKQRRWKALQRQSL
jgi:hypothetical protein